MNLIEKILSIPKSFYVSIRLFPLRQAVKLPVLVRYNTKIISLKGKIILTDKVIKRGLLQIGFGNVGLYDNKYQRAILEIDGILSMGGGKIHFGRSSKIIISNTGRMIIGHNFVNTGGGSFICTNDVKIGNNVTFAWDSLLMDTDWHSVMNTESGQVYNASGNVKIGNNCWIGARCVILKNTSIPDGCIMGANSTANKNYHINNALLAGTPAVVKKYNITKSTKGDLLIP